MAYGDFKDLPRRTVADKALYDKAFSIAKTRHFTDISTELLQWYIYIFLKKRFLLVVLPRIN